MSSFPADDAYTENGIDQGDLRQRLTDHLLATKQLVGAAGEEALTIASGAITPTRGTVKVDTESAAATDNLDLIAATNIPDGSSLLLRAVDAGRVVTVRHNQAGTGGINLSGGLSLALNQVDQWLWLQRRGSSGAYWFEVARFGREIEHEVGAAGEPAYQNSWTGSLRFWKDENGTVRLRGNATKTGSVSASSVLFTLPAGYRPSATGIYPVWGTGNGTVGLMMFLSVNSSGEVFWNASPNGAETTVIVNANPVAFRAEA